MTRAMQHLAEWRRAREQVAEPPHVHHVDRTLAIFGAGVVGWITLVLMTLQGLTYLSAILE